MMLNTLDGTFKRLNFNTFVPKYLVNILKKVFKSQE